MNLCVGIEFWVECCNKLILLACCHNISVYGSKYTDALSGFCNIRGTDKCHWYDAQAIEF